MARYELITILKGDIRWVRRVEPLDVERERAAGIVPEEQVERRDPAFRGILFQCDGHVFPERRRCEKDSAPATRDADGATSRREGE